MPPTETPPPPPFGGTLSTSLLDDIWANALDPGYDEQMRARAEGRATGQRSGRRRTATVLLALVLGAAAAAAATQVHRSLDDSRGTKQALLRQVEQQQQTVGRLGTQEDGLRNQVTAARARQLAATTQGDRLAAEVQAGEDAVAATPLVGPGVTVRISDAKDVATGTADPGLVTDGDLRDVVNALWAAGAEAIAVNGLRLGPATAIRTAGEAILVDFRPVTSPYLVTAIGAQNALQTGLAASTVGARIRALQSAYGIGFSVRAAGALHLAGTTTADSRYAQPLTTGAAP